jgi:hypothetical protein
MLSTIIKRITANVTINKNASASIALVIIGLLILGMLLHLLSASLFDGYFVDTATIILKFVLTTMLALALSLSE